VKQRQAEEELSRLQDVLTKVVNEAGARTRQEVPYSAYFSYSVGFIYLL